MSEVKTKPTKQQTALRDKRWRQLIDATIIAIGQHGLSKITLAQVGKIAKQSPSIVNFYFRGKEQLLLETLDFLSSEYNRKVTDIVNSNSNPVATVTDMVNMNFSKQICSADKVAVWYAFTSESRARKDYLRICGDKDAEYSHQLRQQFALLCEVANKPPTHTEIFVAGLEGLIQNYWQKLLFRPDQFDRTAAATDCLNYVAHFFPEQFSYIENPKNTEATDSEIETSDLLPVWTYQSREFYNLEIGEIFRRNWMLTGHTSNIPNTGDYYTFDCFGERAIIVRGKDGEVRAFHNVCRHRGARLASDSHGNCPRRLVCPFHGWSYHLDGRLQMMPMSKTFPGVNKSDIRLKTIECGIWHGFIFIRFDGGDMGLDEYLQPLESWVAPYRMADMHPLRRPDGETRPYNWKIIHDIDNEGYHVPMGHPGLQALYGGCYKDIVHEGFAISIGDMRPPRKDDTWSVAAYKKHLPDFPHLSDEKKRSWVYAGIFPNLVLAMYPDMMEFYMTIPRSPEQTIFYTGAYALPDDRREVRLCRYLNTRINRETDGEDESFVRSMQEGLNSSVFPQFTLSTLETGVRFFHKKIQSALPVASRASRPPEGAVAQVNQQMAA